MITKNPVKQAMNKYLLMYARDSVGRTRAGSACLSRGALALSTALVFVGRKGAESPLARLRVEGVIMLS
jgi:hypothetical protein